MYEFAARPILDRPARSASASVLVPCPTDTSVSFPIESRVHFDANFTAQSAKKRRRRAPLHHSIEFSKEVDFDPVGVYRCLAEAPAHPYAQALL